MPSDIAIRRPTRKEIDLFYKTHRSRFYAPERVDVFHIVKNINELTSREEATRTMRQAELELAQARGFSETAECYSDCPQNGGYLGWIAPGDMVEEFENVVFSLEEGDISEIFETRFGLHIAYLADRRPAGIMPLREVYDQIAEILYQQRLRDAANPKS